MIKGVNESVGEEALQFRSNVRLDGEHVSRLKLFALLEKMKDSRRAIRRPPDVGQHASISVGSDASVGGCQKPGWRIVYVRELIKGHVAGPVVSGIGS